MADATPENCLECKWHIYTKSPTTGCRTLWADYCKFMNKAFGKLHIVLRGEYRTLLKHDEDDLKDTFPYECPYFNASRAFWEMPAILRMSDAIFVYDVLGHPESYRGMYVYGLSDTINYVMSNLPTSIRLMLHFMTVVNSDRSWFITNFGAKSVLASRVNPDDWIYNPPIEPI